MVLFTLGRFFHGLKQESDDDKQVAIPGFRV